MEPSIRREAAPELTEDAASHHGQYEQEMRWQLAGRGGNRSPEDSGGEAEAVDSSHILLRSGPTNQGHPSKHSSSAGDHRASAHICNNTGNKMSSIHHHHPHMLHEFFRFSIPHFSINKNVPSEQCFKLTLSFASFRRHGNPFFC